MDRSGEKQREGEALYRERKAAIDAWEVKQLAAVDEMAEELKRRSDISDADRAANALRRAVRESAENQRRDALMVWNRSVLISQIDDEQLRESAAKL